jgi:hypothetical protein
VGFVLEMLAYVAGVFIIGGGVWLIMLGGFPGWWKRVSWPVANPTRGVARLQGIGVVVLGISVIGLVFTNEVSARFGGALVLAALVAYVVALALFVLSTWMSRRTAG